jgi:hypothetical protein
MYEEYGELLVLQPHEPAHLAKYRLNVLKGRPEQSGENELAMLYGQEYNTGDEKNKQRCQ